MCLDVTQKVMVNRVKALKAMDILARFANNEYRYEEWAIMTSDDASDIDDVFWVEIASDDERFKEYYYQFKSIIKSGLFFG